MKWFSCRLIRILPFWLLCLSTAELTCHAAEEGLPLYYWRQKAFVNFGDHISLKLVERIVQRPVEVYSRHPYKKRRKLLAIGSLLYFAEDHDVLWGTGMNAKYLKKEEYSFRTLDIRAVRGPLTRQFLKTTFDIDAPEVYGDPALLFPWFFPEFQRKEHPKYEYIIIPHYSEIKLFPKNAEGNVVYPTDPWDEVIEKILDSKFVISSSLHGIIIAEAYGIPARWLRVSEKEPPFKYYDYYLGTNRSRFAYARSVPEALEMGGESPMQCDLQKLYDAFPFEYFPMVR